MPESLGVMGGTFDPIHLGHLLAAEEARQRFRLDRVVFVPNREPPHKREYPVTAAGHRLAMAVLATAGNPCFEASSIEVDRPGPSYTVDTMRAFREQVGPSGRLYFITGADALIETVTWRHPEEIAALCEFVAVTRPGYPLERLSETPLAPGTRLHTLHIPGLEISSTEIRRRAACGEPVRYLVPPPVARYIETNRLYAAAQGACAAPEAE